MGLAFVLLFFLGFFALLLAGFALLAVMRLSREHILATRDLAEFIKAGSLQEKVMLDEARKPQELIEPTPPPPSPKTSDDLLEQLIRTGAPVTDVDGHEWELT